MVTREFGVGPLAQDSTSCKISHEVTKRQVNKVKTMNMYNFVNLWYIMVLLLEEKFSVIYFKSR